MRCRPLTKLVYTGATTAAYSGSATLSALLTLADGVTPVSGKLVTLGFSTLHCSATTGAGGTASCTIQPVTAAPGSYTVGAGFAGDATARPANATATFAVTVAPTVTTALAPTVGNPTTSLSATLTSGGSPLSGKTMTLALGSGNSCSAPTDATGTATCAVPTPNTDTATYTATFGGDTSYSSSSDSKTVALFAATTLTYNGAASAVYNGLASLSATLAKTGDGTRLTGRTVAFVLGSQSCQGTTDANGTASCALTIAQAAGGYTVNVAYAGDATTKATTTTSPFTVNLASTTTVAATPIVGATTTPLSATLRSGSSPVANEPMTLALGSNACNATTDSSGVATCSVNTPAGTTAQFIASFTSDGDYASSSDAKTVTLIAPTTLVYNGATTAVYNSSAVLSATLTKTADGSALTGRTITFTLGGQTCQGTTTATGAATCTIANVTADAGPYTILASYAGDALTAPANATKPFTVTKASTTTAAATPVVGNTTTSLSATLTTGSSPLANKSMTLTLGANSCTASTNASGVATCSVTTPSGASALYTATFAGDADYATSSYSQTVTLLAPTTLSFLGLKSGDYHDPTILTAILTGLNNVPISGQTVTFTLGSQSCSGVTVLGIAACTVVVTQPAGTYPVTASFAGSSAYAATTDTDTFTVSHEQTTLTATAPAAVPSGGTATIGGTLLEDGSVPIPGRTLTLTLGTKSCTAVTNALGVGSCSVAVTGALGSVPVTASFAGDADYVAASTNTSAIEYALSTGGTFVIGNKSTSGTVTFWGAQWWKSNSLSGGSAPASFKGFASSPAVPQCGGTWSSGPGNSSSPPSGPLPAYMAVAVTSSTGKSGSAITGNTVSVVVVKTNAGYDANPGHAGTGTVVATIC